MDPSTAEYVEILYRAKFSRANMKGVLVLDFLGSMPACFT
jgi:hypothetical protein